MRQLLSTITALLGSTLILMLGNGLFGTLLSVRMTLEAFGTTTTGVVMSCYFGGLAVGALQAGRVIKRVGHIRAFAVFAAVMTSAVALHGLYVDAIAWGVLRALAGFSAAGLYMVIESWLNERSTATTRGRVFSIYQVVTYLGLGSGQFLLEIRPPDTLDLFLITGLLFALCLIPVSMTRAIHPAPIERHRMALRAVLSGSPTGAAACVAAGLINGAAFALAPVFIIESGLALTAVSAFMGAMIVGGIFLQYPIGHLSDIFDRRLLLAAVNLSLAVVGLVVMYFHASPLPVLAGLAAAFGGLSFTAYPLAVSHINDRIHSADFVSASAAMLFLWGMGAFAGPTIAGWSMRQVGPEGLFVFAAAVAALAGIWALIARGEAVPLDKQGAFVSMARTTSIITEMDPRYEAEGQLDWIDEMQRQEAEHAAQAKPG
ncbi:MFS transporter [Ectothiorhodospiraceae bacterium WFHF3C12]|nr:MFS transporter [Ectothiorhodospiraceae bacterium WFHF3C12]